MSLKVPDFDDLPKVEGMPAGCAWGVFDKNGKKDVYGTLNLLTPDVVKAAASEVKEGVSVSLKYVFRTMYSGIQDSILLQLAHWRDQDTWVLPQRPSAQGP